MKLLVSQSVRAPVSSAFAFQRICLAACIILAPLSITLYLVTWNGNLRQLLLDTALASPTANTG